jgi:hypothetical protein
VCSHQENANQNYTDSISPYQHSYNQENKQNKCYKDEGEKETLYTVGGDVNYSRHCWWGCKLLQALWKSLWRFLKKLKIELPYDPAIPLQIKVNIQPMIIMALFTIAKLWNHLRCSSTDE